MKNRLLKLITICTVMLCLCMGWVSAESMTIYSDPYSSENTYRRLVDGWAKSLENCSADVVFLGDSLTLGGAWEEYFPEQMITNLGVVGDIVEGLMIRVPLVERLTPDKCFVMGGVNNLSYGETIEQIAFHYDQLLKELTALQEENDLTVYVQSLLPVNEEISHFGVSNEEICQMNEEIEKLAHQYHLTYIDVYHAMLDHEGMLERDYTPDGVHLNWQGYETWRDVIQPYMDE